MPDLGGSIFSQIDANNNSATMPGWNGAAAPSTLDNAGRGLQGAITREWNWRNPTVTSAGTATVQTVTYSVAPESLYNGQEFHIISGFTATGATTININGLGAKTLKKIASGVSTDIAANDFYIGDRLIIAYDLTNTVFVLVNWKGATVSLAGYAQTGTDNNFSSKQTFTKAINEAKGAAVASAATTDIWTPADGNYLHITGTTTITSLGTAPQAGAERTIIFDGVLTLTHNATSLILPSGANIITAAGDRMIVRADTTANMIVVDYIRASGQPIVVTASRTLLATLTTTSGTTQSATGLNPALYRYYEIEIVGVSFAGTTSLMLATSGNGGTNYGSAAFISPAVSSASDTFDGIILLMGINGTNQRSPVVPFGVPNTSSSGVSQGQTAPKHATGSGSPVDAIQFSGNGGSTFDAGTIRIYGVP